jgi:hypothetical protein
MFWIALVLGLAFGVAMLRVLWALGTRLLA